MLRKGLSWLGGLVLAGLVLGCTTGSGTGEETVVASEEADEVEIEEDREEAATAQTHVIYMEATQKADGGWGCAVDPDTPVWIASGDIVTFSGDRLPDPAVVETRVVINPAPAKLGKPANTARPANDPPYKIPGKGKSDSMGAVTGVKGNFWIWDARFQFQEPDGGQPEFCTVDPVVCIGDPPPMGPDEENGGTATDEDPGAESDPCQ